MPLHEQNRKTTNAIFPDYGPVKLKFKDTFDLKEFYEALHYWLEEYGWRDGIKSLSGYQYETLYSERVDTGGAKEMWIHWRLNKEPQDAPRLHYHMDINYHILALKKTEIVRDGQKIKAHKGEVELSIQAFIEEKYLEEFEKNKFLKLFVDIFKKRIYNQTLDQKKKELYQEIYIMQNFIKQWFKLKRYLPYEEVKSFYPSYAWPSHHKEQKG